MAVQPPPGQKPPPRGVQTGWRIVSQEQVTDLDPRGRPVLGMRIHFLSGKGTPASVFLPMADYNVDNARGAVQAQAALIDAVHQLTG